jgi:hypothetical protein
VPNAHYVSNITVNVTSVKNTDANLTIEFLYLNMKTPDNITSMIVGTDFLLNSFVGYLTYSNFS